MILSDAPSVVWVCVDCYMTHHGITEDEQGFPYPTDPAPLSLIGEGFDVFAGLPADEHAGDCPVWLGDPNRPDVPVRDAECECERDSFSWRPCEGCGSPLGGDREALTLFPRAD
jgi:hypothetical protein